MSHGVKWYRSAHGEQRLWIGTDDIEAIMEAELEKAGLLPTTERPIVDLEAFVERYLGVELDQYAQLEPEVLGLTEFRTGLPPRILINRDLTGAAIDEDETAPGILGRWRATLAHEASHAVLHRSLFEVDARQASLFETTEEDSVGKLMRCMKANVLYRDGGSDWREIQANRGMAALLMPRTSFTHLAKNLTPAGAGLEAQSKEARSLSALMAVRCAVSRQAAAIRLQSLGIVSPAGQKRLS